ncbi:MAG: hypothetical protein O2910_01945 [Proteobacteria bacterium]|nr:hypothetical protein [Pseudomonadota bacterium]
MREEALRATHKPVNEFEVWELIHRAFSQLLLGFQHGVGTVESVRLARMALEKEPDNVRAKAVLAWSLANVAIEKPDSAKSPDMDEALRIGQQAVRQDRTDTMVLYCWGTVLIYAMRVEEAVTFLEQALVINPNDAQTLAMLGSAYGRMQQQEKAIELVQRAMRLSPEDPRLYLWHGYMGFAHLSNHDFENTAAEARKAVQHHPGFLSAGCYWLPRRQRWVVMTRRRRPFQRYGTSRLTLIPHSR